MDVENKNSAKDKGSSFLYGVLAGGVTCAISIGILSFEAGQHSGRKEVMDYLNSELSAQVNKFQSERFSTGIHENQKSYSQGLDEALNSFEDVSKKVYFRFYEYRPAR